MHYQSGKLFQTLMSLVKNVKFWKMFDHKLHCFILSYMNPYFQKASATPTPTNPVAVVANILRPAAPGNAVVAVIFVVGLAGVVTTIGVVTVATITPGVIGVLR